MVPEPDFLKTELKLIGRLQYHRFRRVAAMLHYYRIDPVTLEERLIERGCSRELSSWIVETASSDTNLATKIEDSETPREHHKDDADDREGHEDAPVANRMRIAHLGFISWMPTH